MTKIYKVRNCDPLGKWDLDRIKALGADYFVYNYIDGGYDGTGIGVWKKDGKFGYVYMGHCSCDGPLEDLNSIMYTLKDLEKIANGNNYEWSYGKSVMEKVRKLENPDE